MASDQGTSQHPGDESVQTAHNAQPRENPRTEAGLLAIVAAVARAWHGRRPISRALQQALRQLLAAADLDFAIVYQCRDDGSGLSITARAGITRRLAARLAPPLPAYKVRQKLAGSRPTPYENLPASPEGRRVPRCLLHVPLHSRGRQLGVLTIGHYRQPRFAPGTVELLADVASQIALGLDNALLHREATLLTADLALAREALAEALRSKEEFLANVTHELRCPLATARMVLETLIEPPPGRLSPDRQQRLLRNALNNLDRLNTLVSDLLDTVRIEHHSQPLGRELVDLCALARQALADLQPECEERGLQLQALIHQHPIRVHGDAEALARLLANLLSNAVKFNKDRGSVLLQLEPSGRQAILSVTDSGIGIPSHARSRIFERFFQVDGSSTRTHGGLGLGLYVAKAIVEDHGGTIRVDSEEKVGSTFTVSLPLA